MTIAAETRAAETFDVECRFLTLERGLLALRRGALEALRAGRDGVEVLDEHEDALAAITRSVEALGEEAAAAWLRQ